MKMIMKKYGCGFIQSAIKFARKWSLPKAYSYGVKKAARKFRSFSEAENICDFLQKTDRQRTFANSGGAPESWL